jgi:hypothetical protein
MSNCLRYAGYHSDTALLEPLMCGSQVRVPVGEKGQNSATDCNLKDHRFHVKTSACPVPKPHHSYLCDVNPRKKPLIPLIKVSQPKPHHILCDVILPCSVRYCIKENKRKKSGISPTKKNYQSLFVPKTSCWNQVRGAPLAASPSTSTSMSAWSGRAGPPGRKNAATNTVQRTSTPDKGRV